MDVAFLGLVAVAVVCLGTVAAVGGWRAGWRAAAWFSGGQLPARPQLRPPVPRRLPSRGTHFATRTAPCTVRTLAPRPYDWEADDGPPPLR